MDDKIYTPSASKLLLVEGKNDCHVIWSLCKHFDTPETFKVYVCGSDGKVIKRINALIASPKPMETIGICIDADNPNLKGKWDAISSKLLEHGYDLPERPSPDGTIVSLEGKPTIGIWLMPDNNIDGMIEDFCLSLAPANAVQYAQSCVVTAKNGGFSTFGDTHRSKATVHTYLAWQDEPGMPLGLAITAKALDPENELASRFNNFLKNLFAPIENTSFVADLLLENFTVQDDTISPAL